jgi:transcriptional regulator with PAS, ATPase and Fis domain
VRVISATHWPLGRFVSTDRFRHDLFYRISGILLALPPLRERPKDLRSLIASEIRLASRTEGKTIAGLAKDAADRLLAYTWPGNLRQLKTVIQTAVALTPAEVIPAEAILLNEVGVSVRDGFSLDAAEQRHIHDVLARVGGNKRHAARVLGVSRSTLDRKLVASDARPRNETTAP